MAKLDWRTSKLRSQPSRAMTDEGKWLKGDLAAKWLSKAEKRSKKKPAK